VLVILTKQQQQNFRLIFFTCLCVKEKDFQNKMAAAATSGGLLIAFTLILLIVFLGCTALVRFRAPAFWQESSAANYYRATFRTVILIFVGGTIAVTVAIPRWTRSNPAFTDYFIGSGMFETCVCADPATFCGEAAGFRAVQGFSVLGLLALGGLTIVSAVGANMQIDEESQMNAANPPAIGSTSPSAAPPAPSPHPGARVRVQGNNNDDDDDEDGPAGNSISPGSSLPSLLCVIILFFTLFCSFFAWVIFAARSLNSACENSGLYFVPTTTNLGWGWVFRFFEWLFITIIAVLYFLCYKKIITGFAFPMSRLHILAILLFCMSCLSTTTATWSTAAQPYKWDSTPNVNGTYTTPGDSSIGVGAFFTCRCGVNDCPANAAAEKAAIAFYLIFFIFFVPRAFYVLTTTRVWQNALQPIYNCFDSAGLTEKFNNIKEKIPARVADLIAGGFALAIPLFLLIAIIITAGVVASEKCGLTQQAADFGLVFSVLALFACFFEGFVAFLDALMPVGGAMTDEEGEEGEENNNNNSNDQQQDNKSKSNGEEGDDEMANTQTQMNNNQQQQGQNAINKKNLKQQQQQQQNSNPEGGDEEENANFSGVVMAPPESDGSMTPTDSQQHRNNHKFNNPYVAQQQQSPSKNNKQQQQQQQQSGGNPTTTTSPSSKKSKKQQQQRQEDSIVVDSPARMSPAGDAGDDSSMSASVSAQQQQQNQNARMTPTNGGGSGSGRSHSRSNSQQQQQQSRSQNGTPRNNSIQQQNLPPPPPPPPPRVQQAKARVDPSD